MISFKRVSYTYAHADRPAVSDVTLTVAPGEVKVVTGASGCGKTTLMRLANGLCPQLYKGTMSGTVTAAGLDVPTTPIADLAGFVGTLFQDPEEQFFALSVGDEIAFALRSRGVPTEDIRVRTERAAERLGITGLLTQDIHALSEGQKQKVGLAALLALGPKVLVFDEPSANLDPEATEALAHTVAELKSEGTAILIVDHRLYWLRDVADAVIVMRDGHIVREGPFSMLDDDIFRRAYGLRRPTVLDRRRTLPRIRVTTGALSDADETPAFAAENLTFAYDGAEPLFESASFAVPAGVTALIGDNGTGKTTLARVLTGLNKAEGRFWAGGKPVGPEGLMPSAGLVLQNADHQLQMRTVEEELQSALTAGRIGRRGAVKGLKRLTLGLFGLSARTRPDDADRMTELLGKLNLEHLRARHPQSLSGGEKQRLMIGCALAKEPSVLILDEPTSGLDGANMAAIAAVLAAERDAGRAVFLITHDLELLDVCDRALVMNDFQQHRL